MSKLKIVIIHLLLALITCLFVANPFYSELKNKSESSKLLLNMYKTSLETELSRYKFLPFLLSQNEKIAAILTGEFDTKSSGFFLQQTKYATNVSTIYVLDTNGKTIASSNWYKKESYIGKNFGFRPYFKDAMSGKLGQFYGVGIASSTPGFFISYAVKSKEAIVGAIVIEINLSDLEQVWRSGPDDVLVSDVNDIIFLSSNEDWKNNGFGSKGSSDAERWISDRKIENAVENPTLKKKCYRFGNITFYTDPVFSCVFPAEYSIKEEIVEFGWTIYSIQSARHIYNAASLVFFITLLIYLIIIVLYRSFRNKFRRSLQKLRNQLVENSKLAAIGQMATEVAHEFNQPLSAIYMLLDTTRLLLERKQHKDVDDNLVLISSHIERLTQQISQLKAFASRHRVPKGNADVVAVAKASIRLFKLTLKKHDVQIGFHANEHELFVPCNEIGLEQIFSNLITNSLEAMDKRDGKKIQISIIEQNDQVIVRVSDSGPGIEDPSKIFETFYSTKQRGTGLGLAIVNGIVENSGGSISVRNLSKEGAQFTLKWPVWSAEKNASQSGD